PREIRPILRGSGEDRNHFDRREQSGRRSKSRSINGVLFGNVMPHDFTTRKRVMLGALIFLAAADIALGAYGWQLASVPFTPEGEFTSRERLLKRLHAEIERAQEIRDETPKTQKDCDEFEKSLLPAGTGYSSVSAELGKIE